MTKHSLGPLYDVVARAFPRHRTDTNIFDVRRLADDLEMTFEGVYKWFRLNKLSARAAVRLIRLAKRNRLTLTLDRLLKFIPEE